METQHKNILTKGAIGRELHEFHQRLAEGRFRYLQKWAVLLKKSVLVKLIPVSLIVCMRAAISFV
jgi:hypothetical protein